MSALLPVYQDICNQSAALERALAHHRGPGQAALERAALVIQQAFQQQRPVAVVGIGASYSGSIPFVHRMAEGGQRVILEDASDFLHYTYLGYAEPSVILLVSRSGSTIEITRILERIHGRGHFVIGVTNVPDSPLARQSNLTLLMGGPNDHLIAIQTYLTTLLTLDLLVDAVLGYPRSSRLDGLPEAVSTTVEIFRARSAGWRAALRPFQAAYLLGRGPGLASALEGGLLFHEMARFPAVAFGAGAFRHGMWEVADQRLRCFVFAPLDTTYELNLSLAIDLARLGAATTLITPQPPDGIEPDQNLEIWEIPKSAAHFSYYLDIIPLQLFTYELAVWQGLTPGEFRTATPVILTESGGIAGEEPPRG